MINRAPTIQFYILKEFLKRFVPAWVILFFIFVLQTFWVYFDELAGKGLSAWVIFKFFYYFSPNILLYSLPLAALLAGLMTYGNLGENYELAAIKSSGLSLPQSMRYLVIFNIFLALFVIFIANYLQPAGNYKFTQLRRAIGRKMPAAVIRQGMFSGIGDYNIKVSEKYGENDRFLKDVIIHQEINGLPDRVIVAKNGELLNDEKNSFLKLKLYEGEFFEDMTRRQRKSTDRKQLPALLTRFETYIINMDLSGMNTLKESKSKMRIYHMLNIPELNHAIDSLRRELVLRKAKFYKELYRRHSILTPNKKLVPRNQIVFPPEMSPSSANSIVTRALNKAQANKSFVERKNKAFKDQQVFINKYIHTLQEKFSLPVYIFLLFLIGIPLGAIIRKGGFGLPFVLGLLIYVTFYMIAMIGQNLSEEGIIPPWLGAWLPVLIMLPLAVYMIWVVNRIPEFNLGEKIQLLFKKTLKRLHLTRSEKQTDVIYMALPGPDMRIKGRENVFYTHETGVLLKKERVDFHDFLEQLKEMSRQYQTKVIGYRKLDDRFKRQYDILGDVFMIQVDPDGKIQITTDLDINYVLENRKFVFLKNAKQSFTHYKKLFDLH